jgi:hypothetical protein
MRFSTPSALIIVLLSSVMFFHCGAPAQSKRWTDIGFGGGPVLEASTPGWGRHLVMRLSNAPANAPVAFVIGLMRVDLPVPGGTLVPSIDIYVVTQTAPIFGVASASVRAPHACHLQVPLWLQAVVSTPSGLVFSNALSGTIRDEVSSDFNGDGLADLAIGVPEEDRSGANGAGAVNIVYGGGALPSQLIYQGADINGTLLNGPEEDDRFGSALATGDFDGDGFDDLAIGVPREDAVGPARTDSGIVQVIYGSPQGLQGGGAGRDDQLFRQGIDGLSDSAEDFDWFGKALAAGDFDGDGCDDLAIGVPYEDLGHANQGAVHVIFGSEQGGLSGQGSLLLTESLAEASQDDRFGWNLAAGDFDADGFAELAVAHPYDDIGAAQDAGAVTILKPILPLSLPTVIHQGATIGGVLIEGVAETFDLLGFSLAVGDFDDDGVDDLAIGAPFENINGVAGVGAVNVLYGVAGLGLRGAGNQFWTQDSPGIADSTELADYFGYALAAGDFDGDGASDLAIGVPRESLAVRGGAVHVLYGLAGTGVQANGSQFWHQDSAGVSSTAAMDDMFGFALFAGDIDGDCRLDLAIGVPGEDVNGNNDAGAIHILFGSPAGITSAGEEFWTQVPLPGAPQVNDRLGAALCGSPDQRPL